MEDAARAPVSAPMLPTPSPLRHRRVGRVPGACG